MLARLESRLDLLAGGALDTPARQRTLRATLDWSYSLLGAEERRLFACMAVFTGGADLAAIEAVCGPSRLAVFEPLASLVDQNLVRRMETEATDPQFDMLETVREYALERLETGEEEAPLRQRHAQYYLRLAELAAPELRGQDQLLWLDRLEAEHANLRAAMEWLLREGTTEDSVRLGWAVWLYWVLRGHVPEGRAWMERVLARCDAVPQVARARALCITGILRHSMGDYGGTRELFEEGAALFGATGDKSGAGMSLTGLGVAVMGRGEHSEALELFERGVSCYREAGDNWGVAQAIPYLGMMALGRGEYARAGRYYQEGLVTARRLGDRLGIYKSLYNLARAKQTEGDDGAAELLYREGLSLAAEYGDLAGIAFCLEALSGLAGGRCDYARAVRLLGVGEALLERVRAPRYPYVAARSIYDSTMAAARSALGEGAFTGAWAEGRSMKLEQVIEYALTENSPDLADPLPA
jgi:tetratricopeptide (TPR) repeat protein